MSKELFFEDDEFIISKTDTKGVITYENELFIKMSGYSEKELMGQQHNILRHPDIPASIFKLLWDTISNGKIIGYHSSASALQVLNSLYQTLFNTEKSRSGVTVRMQKLHEILNSKGVIYEKFILSL